MSHTMSKPPSTQPPSRQLVPRTKWIHEKCQHQALDSKPGVFCFGTTASQDDQPPRRPPPPKMLSSQGVQAPKTPLYTTHCGHHAHQQWPPAREGREDLPPIQRGAHTSNTSCTRWILQAGMLKAKSVCRLREPLKPAPIKFKSRQPQRSQAYPSNKCPTRSNQEARSKSKD